MSDCWDSDPLLDALYEGLFDPKTLKRVLELASDRLSACGASYHVFSKTTLESLFYVGHGKVYTDDKIVGAYLDHWQFVNPHRDAVRRAHAECPYSAFLCHEHISEADWNRGAYFQEFFSKLGMRWVAGAVVWDGPETEAVVGFARSASKPHFGEEDRAFLHKFLPHVGRATRLAYKLGTAETIRKLNFDGVLDSTRAPSFLVDADCIVQWQNKSAAELLEQTSELVVRDRQLDLSTESLSRSLRAAVKNAVSQRLADAPPDVLRSEAADQTIEIEVLPATVPAGALVGAQSLALVMVRPRGLAPTVNELLKARHGLTKAESRLAVALAEGSSVDEAAQANGISPHTARTQLRSIFSKTGVNRQSALTALIWKSA